MKKRVAIFTTTRAEFGIFTALIREIEKSNAIEYQLFVGGSHLAYEKGSTINEIRNLNYQITDIFDYELNDSSDFSIVKSLGIEITELAQIFKTHVFDFVCILGDRVELLPIATAAITFRKPIIHIHGGEKSEGAIDEQIRHMLTKASHIHFAACSEYADNIIKMGESDWRVNNVGALAVDNMIHLPKMKKEDLFNFLSLDENLPVVMMTYHPVTLEFEFSSSQQIINIFECLSNHNIQLVISAPNADSDRDNINNLIKEYVSQNANYRFIESLGVQKYLSLIPHCSFVIGNSSSAIIEVPFYKIPVVNIGSRQNGRIMHDNIISCGYELNDINNAIDKALSSDFKESLKNMPYKFGDGKTGKRIVDIISKIELNNGLITKKLNY